MIKGRGVGERRKQGGKIEPKYATSPTVLTEEVMLTATTDALEVRDVALVDIPGAYLSADMDNELHIVFRGTLVDMMVAADTALYRTFVSYCLCSIGFRIPETCQSVGTSLFRFTRIQES